MPYIEEVNDRSGRKKYRAHIKVRGMKRESETFDKRGDAVKWGTKREAQLYEGKLDNAERARMHTVAEMVDKYIELVLPFKTDRKRFADQQKQQLLWWKQKLGDTTLYHLKPSMIVEARDSLMTGRRKRGPATANRYVAALRHALTIAVDQWQWMDANPCKSVEDLREPPARSRFLFEGEFAQFMQACAAMHRRPLLLIVMLAIATGGRKSEILNLRVKHVQTDDERGTLLVEKTKTRTKKMLHIAGMPLEMLRQYLGQRRRRADDFLFPNTGNDGAAIIDGDFREARDKAKLKDFRFHDLRHTHASYLAARGKSLKEIGESLGHASVASTQRYAHLASKHIANMVSEMNIDVFANINTLQENPHEPPQE